MKVSKWQENMDKMKGFILFREPEVDNFMYRILCHWSHTYPLTDKKSGKKFDIYVALVIKFQFKI